MAAAPQPWASVRYYLYRHESAAEHDEGGPRYENK